MFYAYAYDKDKKLIEKIPVKRTEHDGYFETRVDKNIIPDLTEYVDFMPSYGNASDSEKGYMVAPKGGPYVKNSYMMCKFKKQDDYEHIVEDSAIALFGVKKEDMCFAAIVTGMRCDYDTIVGVKDGNHYIFPRFKLDGEPAYEDIAVRYYILPNNSDYCTMAHIYRKYQLDRGACVPLKERVKGNKQLDYSANAINVRIRMGMKPIPTPVMEQTLENEPEMVTCCTFDRFKELVDEFKKQGIEKAEFCMIGWNLKGHDGRYPDMFPVEEQLGGEEKLREAIKYGQDNGYQVTCHTNSSDAYTIASMWNEDDILVLKDGTISVDPNPWSGGRMYQLCPQIALKQAKQLLPKVADLGFKGIHYIDVISLHPPRKCYSEKHPLNKKQAVEINDEIMSLTKKLFGGFSSEGAYDVNIGNLDFALLVHSMTMENQIPICDRVIPLWELVYHGIVLHNTSWETGTFNNSQDTLDTVENKKKRLKNIEFGGRPVAYYNMAFHGHIEDLGKDLSVQTDEIMKNSVTRTKTMCDDYKTLSYLQYELMESHKEIADNVFETVYSDGSRTIVDYNKLEYRLIKGQN